LYKYNVVTYQISIDGLPDVKHRVLNNGESTFEKIFENLKMIKENIKFQMFSITIRINFTKELLARADEIVNLFYSEFGKDKRFCFSFIPVFDWSYKDSDYMKAEQLQEELIHEKDVSNIMKKYGDKLDFKAWTNLLFAHNDCWAGTKHGYTIDANGDILKCDFKLEGFEENKVGSIDKNGNINFNDHKESLWIFDSPLPECYNCECFPLCLSTSCGAARIQGIMQNKCLSFKQRVQDYLEIESYNSNNHFMEVSL
jgi:radical SAM protein with 4Fe4S-binding SPASM domain